MAPPSGRFEPPPIEDYGLLGDTRTAALVSSDGSIDWLCAPRFDSQPMFARLVGGPGAGHFRMGPTAPAAAVRARRYRPDTSTIETTWQAGAGRLTLSEALVANPTSSLPSTLLVRRLTAEGAPVEACIDVDPRLGERHLPPRAEHRAGTLVCSWPGLAVALRSSPPVAIEPARPTTTTIVPGSPLTVAMGAALHQPLLYPLPEAAWAALEADEGFWRQWCEGIDPDVPQRRAVVRSLLTLRLLTYSPSGAPVAAPTTSLPEDPGGVRNWDYRYAWPRDASIGIGAFLGVGKPEEARHFLAWLLHASRLDRPRLPVLFDVHGRRPRSERELPGWPGYAESRPVRVGNGAATQHQLDGYGWVLDAAWLLTSAGHPLDSETWRAMRGFADEVARRWPEPDAGIWEIRGDGAHHVHSKLMAWLALDRAARVARTHRTRPRQLARWRAARAAVAADLDARGYNPAVGAYTRSYGSDDLDAAVLILPLLDIGPPTSPRIVSTVDAIARELDAGGPLLYRYPPGRDGLPGGEGAFLPCSFWLAQALAVTGRPAAAGARLDELVSLASPLGLFAEEVDPGTHAHLGNYPQALTHAALVQAALAVRDASRIDRTPTGAQPSESTPPECDQVAAGAVGEPGWVINSKRCPSGSSKYPPRPPKR
jgi:GH15 family glucan-1,4-alpha-glucosidase